MKAKILILVSIMLFLSMTACSKKDPINPSSVNKEESKEKVQSGETAKTEDKVDVENRTEETQSEGLETNAKTIYKTYKEIGENSLKNNDYIVFETYFPTMEFEFLMNNPDAYFSDVERVKSAIVSGTIFKDFNEEYAKHGTSIPDYMVMSREENIKLYRIMGENILKLVKYVYVDEKLVGKQLETMLDDDKAYEYYNAIYEAKEQLSN